jgi:hypothetical protein
MSEFETIVLAVIVGHAAYNGAIRIIAWLFAGIIRGWR